MFKSLYMNIVKKLIKKVSSQNRSFQIFLIVSLILTWLLFIRLNNSIKLTYKIIRPSDIQNSPHNICEINECETEQSQKHGDLFKLFPLDWSSCYNDFYLNAFDNNETSVDTLIDVGANKAYAVATWLSFFSPEIGINQARLGEYIRSLQTLSEPCGSCNDCKDSPLKRDNTEKKLQLQIHAFEPQPGTVDVLKGIKKWMNISTISDVTFEVHGMAVSDHTGHALFRKCNAGNEVCSLDISGVAQNAQIQVNTTSLDDFADKNNLSKVDILKIDTEGYEPLVFRGAQRLLKEHRIRLFIFEYLADGVWRNTSLEIEIAKLAKLDYVCYMVGKTGVIRVSKCWNDKFNVNHCNLLCVSAKDERLLFNIDQMRVRSSVATTCKTISRS
ncbi:unnamed protein product [Rotaria socialis]